MFIAELFTIPKIRNKPNCPSIDEGIKLWNIYTLEFYLAVKKEEDSTLCNSMNLENIMLSEISQSEKDKYHMISFMCGI